MARTVDQIKAQIDEQIAAKPLLAILILNPSQAAIWKDFRHAIAVCIAFFEQLLDKFKSDIEETISSAPPHTAPWVRQKAFEFQYDATTPQVLVLGSDLVPRYPDIDPSKRIISVCCTRLNTSRLLEMKVATGIPPAKLTSGQLSAIQGYFNDGGDTTTLGVGLGIAGVAYDIQSLDPDLLFMEATIFYNGQYAATIKNDVILAIETYLANLPPTGRFKTISLIDAIQSVNGGNAVNDIDIVNLALRPASLAFPGGDTYLVQTSATLGTELDVVAGYAIGETTTANTLADKLTFTVG